MRRAVVFVELLHVDNGGHGGGAAAEEGGARGGRGLRDGPVDGDGRPEAVEPLLFVEDVVDLEGVGGVGLGGVLGADAEDVFSFVCVTEGPSEGPSHSHVSVLKIF